MGNRKYIGIWRASKELSGWKRVVFLIICPIYITLKIVQLVFLFCVWLITGKDYFYKF